jgi:uncharacterized protein (TIGR03083 family)
MTDTRPGTDTPPAADTGAPAGYQRVRRNVAALVVGDPSPTSRPVPHCPGWTVRDVLVHLVEVGARVHDRVTGQSSAPVPAGAGVAELLARWEELSGPVDRHLAGPGPAQRDIVVMDAYTHELDLRQALGVAPPRQHPALPVAIRVLVTGLGAALAGHGLPALEVRSEHGSLVAGQGDPGATVSGPWYELYLALSGRRTEARIRALEWSEDPQRWLPAFTWGPFRVPEGGSPAGVLLDGVR